MRAGTAVGRGYPGLVGAVGGGQAGARAGTACWDRGDFVQHAPSLRFRFKAWDWRGGGTQHGCLRPSAWELGLQAFPSDGIWPRD